jgi:hypothetical protein
MLIAAPWLLMLLSAVAATTSLLVLLLIAFESVSSAHDFPVGSRNYRSHAPVLPPERTKLTLPLLTVHLSQGDVSAAAPLAAALRAACTAMARHEGGKVTDSFAAAGHDMIGVVLEAEPLSAVPVELLRAAVDFQGALAVQNPLGVAFGVVFFYPPPPPPHTHTHTHTITTNHQPPSITHHPPSSPPPPPPLPKTTTLTTPLSKITHVHALTRHSLTHTHPHALTRTHTHPRTNRL